MSLQKMYDEVQATVSSQKYKMAMDVVNINTRLNGLLAEMATLKDILINVKANPENVAVCDEAEMAELQSVIDRIDIEAAAQAISADPMKATETP
jgi:hypothetical protein